MRTVDVIVGVPLIPLFPVLATWWLPWERWLWEKVPKWILGPYLLYAAFAAWHFAMPWWVCGIIACFGAVATFVAAHSNTKKDEKKET